ncbi:MAG: (2Fe-2S)-binding protein [Burkholderiales bacterium]
MTLNINGKDNTLDIEEDMPLLWALRDVLNMTGTKFGCGVAACGACTVHVDGAPTRSCIMPVSLMAGKKIRTIEALEQDGKLHKVQQAWIQAQAPQCGYCQSGMIMAAVSLLEQKPDPTDADIDGAISNICRCGTYPRVREAIRLAAKMGGSK